MSLSRQATQPPVVGKEQCQASQHPLHLSRNNFGLWEHSQAQNRYNKPKLLVDKYFEGGDKETQTAGQQTAASTPDAAVRCPICGKVMQLQQIIQPKKRQPP